MTLKTFLRAFGILAVILTLIPLIAADYWWIRMFDYPHIQLTLLTLAALAAYFLRFEIKSWRDYAFVGVLLICFLYQFVKIMPYTPLVPLEVGEPSENVDENSGFTLLTSNVLEKNKEYQKVIAEVQSIDPDMVVFTETDGIWLNEIEGALASEFPYRVNIPIHNTYGMLLFSKLKLINPEKRFIVDDNIPSIHTEVELRNGKRFRLHAVHPTPPMPQENPSSTDRDAELMKVALETRDSELPVIVVGDFNDVAWSQTTTLFKNVGELLDVRVGRSLYNTFDATSFIMRWSLDQIFVSEEWRVHEIHAGEDVGSDHFPFYAKLYLQPELAEEQKPEPATEEQLKTAREQIREEKQEPENN